MLQIPNRSHPSSFAFTMMFSTCGNSYFDVCLKTCTSEIQQPMQLPMAFLDVEVEHIPILWSKCWDPFVGYLPLVLASPPECLCFAEALGKVLGLALRESQPLGIAARLLQSRAPSFPSSRNPTPWRLAKNILQTW